MGHCPEEQTLSLACLTMGGTGLACDALLGKTGQEMNQLPSAMVCAISKLPSS